MTKYILLSLTLLFADVAHAQQLGRKFVSAQGQTLGIMFETFRPPFNERMDMNDDGNPEIVSLQEDDQGITTGLRVVDYASTSTLLELNQEEVTALFGVGKLRVLGFMDLDGDETKELSIVKRSPEPGKFINTADFYADFNASSERDARNHNDSLIVLFTIGNVSSIQRVFPERFTPGKRASEIQTLSAFTISDLDNDGNLDLILGDEETGIVEVWGATAASTGVAGESEIQAGLFRLLQNYPNPFNAETAITYQVREHDRVQLRVYDVLGREVRKLVDESKGSGTHIARWNGRDNGGSMVAAGIYFYQLQAGDHVASKQMIRMK